MKTMTLKQMADFRPFQAWRYDPKTVPLSEVIAPPYDIISPDGQEKLYQKSSYNCVRLILNKIEPSDNEANSRYTRARDFFQAWRSQNILIQDQNPAFYLYCQTFRDPHCGEKRERFALLGVLKLEDFDQGIVIPHEKTLSKPREDRRKLLETTHTNFSPVFGLYDDSRENLHSFYLKIAAASPAFEAVDEEGVSHAVWLIQDGNQIEEIRQKLSRQKIYIADGHHRYQTALEYARAKRSAESAGLEEEKPYDFVYMALVGFHDPGLLVFPTHRIVRSYPGFDPVKAFEALSKFFKIEAISPEKLDEKALQASQGPAFGLFMGDQAYLLSLNTQSAWKGSMPAGKPDVWYQLDVNILGHLIFSNLWNLPEKDWESTVGFTQSVSEMQNLVKGGKAAAAFMLRPPRVEILRDMGRARELMPQKSTYFYPKLASGILFYHHGH
ncbi:MAG: DUF1015 domain-containing protein [Candidatus Omnitrophica bacterium]|nr:DUF1015 domain-containing protein [Candidatus Omnitrophota bacterium]